jgi:hypothetical protein
MKFGCRQLQNRLVKKLDEDSTH